MNRAAPNQEHRWEHLARLVAEPGCVDRFAASAPTRRCEDFLELAWPSVEAHDVSWIGFYLEDPTAPETRRLTLGPSRGGPACSPIGLHGACGQAFKAGRPLVVKDVRELGEDYIACDPRDRSELVVPITSEARVIGVLDVDSHQVNAFSQRDLEALLPLMALLGLLDPPLQP